ncbi:MAG: hypothetical protein U0X39_13250 [Bacteroidales bacterium]
MDTLIDVLLVTTPAIIVFLTAFFVMRNMIKNDQDKRRQEVYLQNSKIITPIRLQAYERVVLFLERISLESLLVRASAPGMSAAQLHSALLLSIRSEFEHNLSQQIYMTVQAWEVVKNARSNTIKLINTAFEKMPENATSVDLGKELLSRVMELEKEYTRVAIEYVRNEVSTIM